MKLSTISTFLLTLALVFATDVKADGPTKSSMKETLRSMGFQVSAVAEAGAITFFTAFDPEHGYELWRTDGTKQGTILLRDIRQGSISSEIHDLRIVDGSVFFIANDGIYGSDQWTSDGTVAGTIPVHDPFRGRN